MAEEIIFEREAPLNWWRNILHDTQRQSLASKYKSYWSFAMVDKSSSAIEYIYKKHHQSAK